MNRRTCSIYKLCDAAGTEYTQASYVMMKESPVIEKSCGPGETWVNHIYDNPGKTTCECYPMNDPCLADGACEIYPECSRLTPSEDVIFLDDDDDDDDDGQSRGGNSRHGGEWFVNTNYGG